MKNKENVHPQILAILIDLGGRINRKSFRIQAQYSIIEGDKKKTAITLAYSHILLIILTIQACVIINNLQRLFIITEGYPH